MAKSKIPDPLTRRHLLEREVDAGTARKIADAYLAVDRRVEAVPFLVKARADDVLSEIRSHAIREGDVFLLKSLCGALNEEPSIDEWREIGDFAEALEKLRYSALAKRRLESGEE